MTHLIDLTYLPCVAYLTLVCGLMLSVGRCPVWVHPVLLAVGLGFRITQSGLVEPTVTTGIAALAFLLLVFVLADRISGVSILTLVTSAALLPLDGWVPLGGGLLLAAGAAAFRVRSILGEGHVTLLATETVLSMGVNPAGSFHKPDLSTMPVASVDVHDGSRRAARMKMRLAPYLLSAVVLGGVLSALTTR